MSRPVFRSEDVARISKHCAAALSDDVSDVFVTTRDLGAVLGVGIELPDGRRHAVMVFANGTTDGAAGHVAVDMLREWMQRVGRIA
jgi:hypothetical protein